MLKLTRKPGEVVFITDTRTGERIAEVHVAPIQPTNRQVSLGFVGPSYIQFLRDDAKELRRDRS